MPIVDDIAPRNVITDKIKVDETYDGVIVAVDEDGDPAKHRYYVTWYLPALKGIYKEKGKGTMLQYSGAAKKLAVIFLYHVNFPGKDVEPVEKSNVFPAINRRIFDTDRLENWLGLTASLKFTEEPAFDKTTQTYSHTKMYKNIKRNFNPKLDGIQPNLNMGRWSADQVKAIVDEYLTEDEEKAGSGKAEDDLPF